MADPFPLTRAVIERGISERLHIGAQLFVQHDQKILADVAFGESRPNVPMTVDTLNPWMSSGKPVAAVAIAQLWERGLLDWDDRVTKFIPEFSAGGKGAITIRHILTHTAGFRAVLDLRASDSYEDAIKKICRAPLEPRWSPGVTAGYHAVTSWYVIAEISRRVDGRPFEKFVRDEIFLPLGMNDSWFALSSKEYRAYGERIGFIYDTSSGELRQPPNADSEESAAILRPGASARGPIRQLGRFYQMLMNDGKSLLKPATVKLLISRHRDGVFDLTFKHIKNWGLGFMLKTRGDSQMAYGFPDSAGDGTFGHSGQQSSCAFCDPRKKIIAAWMCNGMPGDLRHAARHRQINEAIYNDLIDTLRVSAE